MSLNKFVLATKVCLGLVNFGIFKAPATVASPEWTFAVLWSVNARGEREKTRKSGHGQVDLSSVVRSCFTCARRSFIALPLLADRMGYLNQPENPI